MSYPSETRIRGTISVPLRADFSAGCPEIDARVSGIFVRHDIVQLSFQGESKRKMAGSRIDLEAELDHLFSVRPEEFVSTRTAIAARLKASGRGADATRIKALKRPSVPAWAVNQLRFEAPRILAALLASGDRLRSRSSDMPSAMQARREAVVEARKKAAELLAAGGHAATPQTMQRVSATLEALATYGNAPDHAEAGRLTEELPAPGFDEVASLGILRGAGAPKARAPRPPSPTATIQQRSEKAERVTAHERAMNVRALSARKREAALLHRKLAAAEKKAELARKTKKELETPLAKASQDERKSQQAVDAARKAVDAANVSLGSMPAR